MVHVEIPGNCSAYIGRVKTFFHQKSSWNWEELNYLQNRRKAIEYRLCMQDDLPLTLAFPDRLPVIRFSDKKLRMCCISLTCLVPFYWFSWRYSIQFAFFGVDLSQSMDMCESFCNLLHIGAVHPSFIRLQPFMPSRFPGGLRPSVRMPSQVSSSMDYFW